MNRVTSKQLYKRRTGWVVATAAAGAILGVSGVGVAHADTVTAKDASSVSSVTKQKDNTQSKAVVLKSSAKSSNAVQSSTPAAAKSNVAQSNPQNNAKTTASSMSRADAKRAMNDAALNLAQAKQAAQQSAAKLAQVRSQFASQNGAQSTQNSDNTAGPLANVPSSSVQGTTPLVDAGETNAQGYTDQVPNYEIIEYVDASGKVIAVKRIEDDTNPAENTTSDGAMSEMPSVSPSIIAANAPQGYEVVKASSGLFAGQVVDEAQLNDPNNIATSGTVANSSTGVVTDVYLVKPTGSVNPSSFTQVKPLIYYGDKNTPNDQIANALGNAAYGWTQAQSNAQNYLNSMANGTNPDAVQAEKDGKYQVVTGGPAAIGAPFSDHVTGADGVAGPNYRIVQYVTADGQVVATKRVTEPDNVKALSEPGAPMAIGLMEDADETILNVPAGYELVGYQTLLNGEDPAGSSTAYANDGVRTDVYVVKKIGAADPTNITNTPARVYYGNAETPDSQLANALGNPNFGKSSSTSGNTGSTTNTPATKPSGNTGSTTNTPATKPSGNTGSTTNTPATKPSGNTGSTTNTPTTKPSGNTGSTTNTPATKPSGNTGSTSVTPSVKPSTDTPAAQPSQPSANQPSADKPSANQPATDQPSAVKPTAQQPSANKPSASQPAQPNQPAATVAPNTKGHATQGTPVAPLADQQASSAVDVVFPPQFKDTAVSANAMRRSRVASRMDGQGELANNESQALRRSHKRTLPDTGDAQGVGLIGLGLGAILAAFGFARPARKH